MSRTLHVSYRCPGVRFGKMSGSATVLIDGEAVCRLRDLENRDVMISEEEHAVSVRLDRILIFKNQIGAGTHDWTLALRLKGTNLQDARLTYPLVENIPSAENSEAARRLTVSYIREDDRARALCLYLDGRRAASLGEGPDREFDISNDAHTVQIRSGSIFPCYSGRISAGSNSWQLTGEGRRFMLEEHVPYWIRAVSRKTYADDPEVHSFCGMIPAPQDEQAGIPAVRSKEFVSSWNRACPFTAAGEKWVCFEGENALPVITVQRISPYVHLITPFGKDWIDPLSPVSLVRISASPVPVPDVQRGCWKAELIPVTSVGGESASVYVEYIGQTMYWRYFHEYSWEVGPAGHYEYYPFEYQASHHETEFTDREQLLQRLMDFIPRSADNPVDAVPRAHHISFGSTELRRLLSDFFQDPPQPRT